MTAIVKGLNKQGIILGWDIIVSSFIHRASYNRRSMVVFNLGIAPEIVAAMGAGTALPEQD
jgi:hypothetical protein